MRERALKLVGKISLAILSVILSYQVCYFFAEHFFFDQFFYKKSVAYGYVTDNHTELSKYGDRAKDIIWLENTMKQQEKPEINVDKNVFTIAVIGDSDVWGQGVKNKDRFPKILEEKLNKIRKTKVYSYAAIGDNFLQNYEKIRFFESLSPSHVVDLYILVLVDNDIFVNSTNKYTSDFSGPLLKSCQEYEPFIYNIDVKPTDSLTQYKRIIVSALQNQGNLCLVNKILPELPSNMIIFEPEDIFQNDDIHNVYAAILNKFNLQSVSPHDYLGRLANSPTLFSKMTVSKTEGHPSALANKIFAETLYKLIKNKYEFIQKNN